jgi:hypothetical protein
MKNILFSLACAVLIAGCSTAPVEVNNGPVHAHTFSYLKPPERGLPQYADKRTEVLQYVQDAITTNLVSKGLTKQESGGDVTVAFLVIVGNNVTTTQLSDYFGYSEDAAKLMNKVHEVDTDSGDQRAYFEAGTLVIDIINPTTQKLLWRGSLQRQILRQLPMDQRLARLQETVDAILKKLDIEP